jgi:hypothetical protein
MAISVGLRALAVKNGVDSYPGQVEKLSASQISVPKMWSTSWTSNPACSTRRVNGHNAITLTTW